MKNGIIGFVIALLLVGCGAQAIANTQTPWLVTFSQDGVYALKDWKTGCVYISRGNSYPSSYTYLHGTCTDIIQQENGVAK